ncbi:Aste57867_18747 [Aphanomyces stellatus]|uniref:Aste57867_18747 protein n=1 Tax=Aphanomyces stellatus TaxID=120398 RepID=A0A485LBH0_9STRA|nr:hypothetical protein As57867_018683 [Aphanomyces stellatus]VFT95481.1 Aste57867_18747 [Aphanomyces stellatus]
MAEGPFSTEESGDRPIFFLKLWVKGEGTRVDDDDVRMTAMDDADRVRPGNRFPEKDVVEWPRLNPGHAAIELSLVSDPPVLGWPLVTRELRRPALCFMELPTMDVIIQFDKPNAVLLATCAKNMTRCSSAEIVCVSLTPPRW